MHDLAAGIARMKGRWMIGGTALEQAPADWQAVAGSDAEPELALLAIAGQAILMVHRQGAGGDMAPAKRLPRLALPPLPEELRPRFRRLHEILKPTNEQMALILRLMAKRGHTVHPADWMPSSVDELPEVYAPWSDWRDRAENEPLDALTSDNWDDWMPADRLLALSDMRRSDPAAALELIRAHAGSLPAEQRLRVVGCLGMRLNDGDADYLDSLDKDRSGKVRALAAEFLARLGRLGDDDASAGELADFFSVRSAGILKRGKVIRVNKVKTDAQRARRRELFGTVSVAGFARALGLTDRQSVEMWTDEDVTALPGFAGMIARTGADDIIGPALDRLLSLKATEAGMIATLLQRLPFEERRPYLGQILQRDDSQLTTSVGFMRDGLGMVSLPELEASGVLKAIAKALKESAADEGHRNDTVLQNSLMSLGLLADAAAAAELTRRFTGMGLISADPALAMLNFNAALTGESE